MSETAVERALGKQGKRQERVLFLALIAPNLILILLFVYRPLVMNVYYSTLDWTLGSPTARKVGFANYVEFFSSHEAADVLRTTAIFTVGTVGGAMALGLAMAVVLNRKLVGRTPARTTVFAPYVLSGVGVGLVWSFIFDPVGGLLAAVLRGWGMRSPEWFNQPGLALTMIIIVYVWKNLGYCAVIYLAGLQSVPRDLLEAASLDGASGHRQFWSIIWPLLSPTTFFLMLTTILSSLQAFDLIRIMTPTGLGTTTLMYDVYMQAFGGYNRAGYASAVSTVLLVILLVLTVIQLRYLEKKVHYA